MSKLTWSYESNGKRIIHEYNYDENGKCTCKVTEKITCNRFERENAKLWNFFDENRFQRSEDEYFNPRFKRINYDYWWYGDVNRFERPDNFEGESWQETQPRTQNSPRAKRMRLLARAKRKLLLP